MTMTMTTPTTSTNPSEKPLPTELFVFIDALGWRTVSRTGFLADLLPERRPLDMQFGYSCTAIPTLLSGRRPSEHGHLGLFVYDPAHSPFRWLSRLAPLFRPRSLWNRGRVRHWLSRLVRLVHGYTGYFQLYRMPLEKLGLMDYGEKRDLFAAHGLAPFDNLHDVLARTTLHWHISNWRHGDQASLDDAENALRNGAQFLFVYTAELDGLLHQHVRQPDVIDKKLRWYEQRLTRLAELARQLRGGCRLTIISDHGMTPLAASVDLMAAIEQTGLRFGLDYAACYDSTMARFHFLAPHARDVILNALRPFADRGHLLSDDEQRRYGILRDDHRFGDAIFLMNPGIQIAPSDMGEQPLPGMHGFAPEDPDSTAAILSSDAIPPDIRSIADVFSLMTQRIRQLQQHTN